MVTEKQRSGTLPGQGRLLPPETQRPRSPSLPAACFQAQLELGGKLGPPGVLGQSAGQSLVAGLAQWGRTESGSGSLGT